MSKEKVLKLFKRQEMIVALFSLAVFIFFSVFSENFFTAVKDEIAAGDGNYVVGVIQHDETQTGIDRAKGFIDKFTELADADASTKGKYKIEKEVKPGDADNAYKT